MNYRLGLFLCAAAWACAGCQSTQVALTALENENRRLEDRVYQLEDALNQHCDLLDGMDRENCSLRAKLVDVKSTGHGNSDKKDSSSKSPGNGDTFTPPKVDLGEPAMPNGQNGDSKEPLGPAPPFEGPAPKFPRLNPSHGTNALPAALDHRALEKLRGNSADVMRLTLDRMPGAKLAQNGHPATVVIVESRNAAGKLIPAVGDVTLVVIDAAKRGDAARLARWDYSADQAAACIRGTALGQRMFFHLDWPDAPVENQNLRLFVRLKTVDGRHLQTDAPLRLDDANNVLREWTKDASPKSPDVQAADATHVVDHPAARKEPISSRPSTAALAEIVVDSGSTEQEAAPKEAANDEQPTDMARSDETAESLDPEVHESPSAPHADRDPPVVRREARSGARRKPVWAPYR